MTADDDLDARLAAAGGIRDEDLPALPESFLAELVREEPASVVAARQLVQDARARRGAGRRRLARRAGVLVAAAAVVATAVVVTNRSGSPAPPAAGPATSVPVTVTPTGPPDDLGPLEAPPGGLALAATDAISFPYSLAEEPAGLTPVLGMSGGLTLFGYTEPVVWRAQYRSEREPGFTFVVSPGDPRILPPGAEENIDAETTTATVPVDGVEGELLAGTYRTRSCGDAPATPQQTDEPVEVCADTFARLTFQRPDGMWVQVFGEDDWATQEAVVGIGSSIVDRPQLVPLQVRLAPAGWSVSSYEDNTSLALISDTDPTIDNRISVSLQERWRGETEPDVAPYADGNPIEQVTVNGQPGQLTSTPNGFPESTPGSRMWTLQYFLPDGVLVFFTAPDLLTREQVLQIAAQVVYEP